MYLPFSPPDFWENYGGNTATSGGTHLTASATANTPGAWVSLGTVNANTPISKFHLFAWNMVAASYPAWGLLDIGIGASGSQTVWIPSLLCIADASGHFDWELLLPLSLPPGTAIWARLSSSVASATVYVSAMGGLLTDPHMPVFQRVTAYGAVPASSQGTAIDPGTVANTPTTTNLTTSSAAGGAFFAILSGTSTSTGISWLADLVVAGTVIVPSAPLYSLLGYYIIPSDVVGPYFYPISVGSTLGVSVQCSSISAARILNGILYVLS